ncbi:MAG: hypothetical protein M1817_006654 [Caeruleum heppii]|nr:MAG: hypothetical protein M1817_006654 [Caeruleum heppii]
MIDTNSILNRFDEESRRAERRRIFNIDGLKSVIAEAIGRPITDLRSLTKLAEGGFNRVLQATFSDGHQVLAKLPYPRLAPAHHAVASEAATLNLLHQRNLPVPKVFGYSTTPMNPAGTEYILLEKVQGRSLGECWFDLDNRARIKVIRQLVSLEQRLFAIDFAASGSLYFQRDLSPSRDSVPLEGRASDLNGLVIGPTAQYEWSFGERAARSRGRGPWHTFRDCFEAVAIRERQWCEEYGTPRLRSERYLRELDQLELRQPATHARLLSEYLALAPFLDYAPNHPLARPVLRHPDFSPNNIMVSDTHEITGIIDWQHAVVLPLGLVAGIPKHFQNWGDTVSEEMRQPETKLPADFDQLSSEEQDQTRELLRKRLVHFLYAAYTKRDIPEHYDALTQESAMLRARLYNLAGAPWEGESVELAHTLATVVQKWPLALKSKGDNGGPALGGEMSCPLKYSVDYLQQCAQDYQAQSEKLQEVAEMRECLDIDSQGWVPDDSHWETSRALAQKIKSGLLQYAETSLERTAITHHFPFDDHEE